MMISRRAWTGLAMAGLRVACGGLQAADDKAGADLKKLEGKWTAPSGTGARSPTPSRGTS